MTDNPTTESQSLLEVATGLHRGGRLAEARTGYTRLLAAEPKHALATFRLALLELQDGALDQSLALFERAVVLDPSEAGFWLGLGQAAEALGQPARAADAYEQASGLKPDDPEVLNLLGNCRRRAGALAAAEAAYRRAIAADPGCLDAVSNLGSLLFDRDRSPEALELLRAAVAARPESATYALNLGIALCTQRDFPAARDLLFEVARLHPDDTDVAFNLGIAFAGTGERALAAAEYERALRLSPDHGPALLNLANVTRELGDFNTAIELYERVLRRDPRSTEALNNCGCLKRTLGDFDVAESLLRRGLAVDPTHGPLLTNLGNLLKDAGDIDAAIHCYRAALDHNPDQPVTHGNLVYALSFSCTDPEPILAEARRWNERFADSLTRSADPAFSGTLDPHRRLRVGYLSPDFREHCQSMFTLPLFLNHDRAAFEIFCYSTVEREDSTTGQLRACVDRWRDVGALDDAALAALIRADGIDILVDLTMHMAGGRPGVLARKTAPRQIAWLAYPGTTGISAIDYRLSDPRLDPAGYDAHYSERTLRLPDTFWCYDPRSDGPAVSGLPALSRGHVTFGCLNNPCKISDLSIALWGRAMRAVPNSRLLLMVPEGRYRGRMAQRLGAVGIDRDRIDFVPFRPRAEYLATYHSIDLGLDTIPYNGHTTSLDSYWMGVPVVTRVGGTCVGRAGLSQLHNLGLLDLAAESDAQFADVVCAIAGDLPRLAVLRRELRERLAQSPLMDAARFARGFERALRTAWASSCDVRNTPTH